MFANNWETHVWFASNNPETLCASTYGYLERATLKVAGPHGMKLTKRRSRTRCNALWTCVGSTSPWMMFSRDK